MTGLRDFWAFGREYGFAPLLLLTAGIICAMLPFFVLYSWLSAQTGWPETYGIRCSRHCLIDYLWHSPRLLRRGTGYEIGLFALFWVVPVSFAIFAVVAWWKRRRKNSILPMDGPGKFW